MVILFSSTLQIIFLLSDAAKVNDLSFAELSCKDSKRFKLDFFGFFIHLFHVLNFFKSYFQIYAPEGQIFANYNNFIHLSTRYYHFF